MSESTLVIRRHFSAACETVFEAWTDPAVMAQWFFVDAEWKVEVQSDFRVGGGYQLRMLTLQGEVYTMHGEYVEIEQPRRLSFTWTSHVAANTLVTIELSPTSSGTDMTLTHSRLTEASKEPHAQGWGGCLANLERHLAARPS